MHRFERIRGCCQRLLLAAASSTSASPLIATWTLRTVTQLIYQRLTQSGPQGDPAETALYLSVFGGLGGRNATEQA